jgi:Concanavalin A-like lectin/glucanases superfamily
MVTMNNMIKLFMLLTLSSTVAMSQSPQQFSYQAVVRDNNNQVLSNRTVGMRISILKDSVGGQSAYIETHTPKSNSLGIVQLNIGGGTVVSGTFASVPWSSGKLFVKTEMDPQGGTNYSFSGTTQLLSVPYALYTTDVPVSKSGDTVTIGKSKLIIPGSQLIPGSAPVSLNNGLVAYYPFNGNANDESGNGRHLVVHGNTSLSNDRFNSTTKAYYLDGNGDYFTTPIFFSSGLDHAFSIWFQLQDSTTTDNTFYNTYPHAIEAAGYNGTAPSRPLLFGYCIGDSADWNKCDQSASFSAPFQKLNWNNLIVNKAGNVWKFYLNGIFVHSYFSPINTPSNPVQLYLGAISSWFSPTAAQFFKGKLDDIRIYHRALTQEEITYIANN